MQKFWCVVREVANGGTTSFSKRHLSPDKARAEAMRLAEREGARFLVMECVGVAGPTHPPIAWTPLGSPSPDETLPGGDTPAVESCVA